MPRGWRQRPSRKAVATRFGREVVLAALHQLRDGVSPAAPEPMASLLALNHEFSVSEGGPVDPDDPEDFPGDRIVAPECALRWGTHRMGVDAGYIVDPPAPTPHVVQVQLDLNMPLEILTAGIGELAHRRGVRPTKNPRHEHPWASAVQARTTSVETAETWAWKDAFQLLRDQLANPDRPVARLARRLPGYDERRPLLKATLLRRAQRMLAAAKKAVKEERLRCTCRLIEDAPYEAEEALGSEAGDAQPGGS